MRPNHKTWWERSHKLGRTDFCNRQTESWSGKLGGTDSLISVRPKCYEGETESLHCELGGTDRSSRLDRNVMKGKESLQSHLGETEIPIGETEVTRVCGSGYVN